MQISDLANHTNPATESLFSTAGAPGRGATGRAQKEEIGLAQDTTASGASSSDSAGSAVITSNDFLTLLVTELKNQDPTSNQDPNAYIDQLVQVNSLQQLIAINQDLSPLTTAPTTAPTTSPTTAPTTSPTTGATTAPTTG